MLAHPGLHPTLEPRAQYLRLRALVPYRDRSQSDIYNHVPTRLKVAIDFRFCSDRIYGGLDRIASALTRRADALVQTTPADPTFDAPCITGRLRNT